MQKKETVVAVVARAGPRLGPRPGLLRKTSAISRHNCGNTARWAVSYCRNSDKFAFAAALSAACSLAAAAYMMAQDLGSHWDSAKQEEARNWSSRRERTGSQCRLRS